MAKKYIVIHTLLTLLLAGSFAIFPSAKAENNKVNIIGGLLDISDTNLEDIGPLYLDGEWEFYWNKLLDYQDFHDIDHPEPNGYFNVPMVWNNYMVDGKKLPGYGYATYRLRVKLNNHEQLMGLKLSHMSTSYRLLINDQLVAQNGKIGRVAAEAEAEYKPIIVFFEPPAADFDIIVQVSNFTYSRGGYWYSVFFGTAGQIITLNEYKDLITFFMFGVLISMALYHIIIYTLHKKKKSILYLAMSLLIVGIRFTVTHEYAILILLPSLSTNLDLLVRIEYFTIFWGMTSFILFCYDSLVEDKSKYFKKILWGGSTLLSLLTIFTKISFFTEYLSYYILFYFIYMSCIVFIYFKALINKKKGAWLIFAEIIFVLAAFSADHLYHSNLINKNTSVIFVTTSLIFLFVQSYYIANEFSDSFSKIRKLSNRLLLFDKLKDEFLANTSQELKLPISSIISVAESILSRGNSYQDQLKNNLSLIINTSKKLNFLVNDLLDYSKIKYNTINLKKEDLELYSIVQSILFYFDVEEINFKNNIKPGKFMVLADKDRLLQIIYNIVDSMVKFMENGEISVDAMKQEEMIEIIISTTENEIPINYQDEVYDSLINLTHLSGEVTGSDIGYSITKYLVEQHGGKIKTELGLGKLFSVLFTLPGSQFSNFNQVDSQYSSELFEVNEVAASKEVADLRQKYILVVDNNSSNLSLLNNILTADGYSVIGVNSGKKALEEISSNSNIVIIILNLLLPDSSGIKICQKIRQRYTLFELPILMLISRSNPEDLIMGLDAGVNEFIKKPYEISELKSRIKTLVTLKENVEKAFANELAFLRAQIKPHFLYNTLNTIVSMCETDQEKASELIIELAEYLRYSFDFENTTEFIGIQKEIELVNRYINIQKARFKDKIKVVYHIEQDLDFKIPPLTLQPLVENSIIHGILKNENGGIIKITLKKKDNSFLISISDNGVGIDQEVLSNISTDRGNIRGVGISNINKRIKKIYNTELKIKSVKGKGTTISILVPVERGQNNIESSIS